MLWAMRREVKFPEERLVLIALADRTDIEGYAHIAWQELVDFVVVGMPEVGATVDCMVEDGHLQVLTSTDEYLYAMLLVDRASPLLPPAARRSAIPAVVRQAVFARDAFRCVYCGTTERLSLDHVEPVIAGGTDDMENLVTACQPCNSSKGARPLAEWLATRTQTVAALA